MQKIQETERHKKKIAVEQRTCISESVVFIRINRRQQIAPADRFRKSLDAGKVKKRIMFDSEKIR